MRGKEPAYFVFILQADIYSDSAEETEENLKYGIHPSIHTEFSVIGLDLGT